MTPRISILIVAYNSSKYIQKTINSCVEQTYRNFELLILDNNSKDNTIKVIRSIQNKKVLLFESGANIGPYRGLNYLIDRAKGKYIAIQDHDDIWLPDKLSKQVTFLERNHNYIACGTLTYYYYEKFKLLALNCKPSETNFVDHTSLVFRNEGFRYNEHYLLADEYFERSILGRSGKIACLQDGLTIHRIKKDNTNLSSRRFRLSYRAVHEFLSLHDFSVNSLMYLLDLIFTKYTPDPIIWYIRRKITQRHAKWISRSQFMADHKGLSL